MGTKSPFFVVKSFVSPMVCETIVDRLFDKQVRYAKNGRVVIDDDNTTNEIYKRFIPVIKSIEEYFDYQNMGVDIDIERYFTGSDEFSFLTHKDFKTKQTHAFEGLLFLSDYQETPPLELEYEVYGGKVKFTSWNFRVLPNRGNMIIFPKNIRFKHIITPVEVGNLFLIRLKLKSTKRWIYEKSKYSLTVKK